MKSLPNTKVPTVHRAGKAASQQWVASLSLHMTAPGQKRLCCHPPREGPAREFHSRQLSGMTFKAKGTKSSKEASRITALMSG